MIILIIIIIFKDYIYLLQGGVVMSSQIAYFSSIVEPLFQFLPGLNSHPELNQFERTIIVTIYILSFDV